MGFQFQVTCQNSCCKQKQIGFGPTWLGPKQAAPMALTTWRAEERIVATSVGRDAPGRNAQDCKYAVARKKELQKCPLGLVETKTKTCGLPRLFNFEPHPCGCVHPLGNSQKGPGSWHSRSVEWPVGAFLRSRGFLRASVAFGGSCSSGLARIRVVVVTQHSVGSVIALIPYTVGQIQDNILLQPCILSRPFVVCCQNSNYSIAATTDTKGST